jgi:hypothetical protein
MIALDINMPNLDARDLMRLLAAASFAGGVFIISGESEAVLGQMQTEAEALGLRVPGVQRKPLDFQRFRAMLMTEGAETQAAAARSA